MSLFPLQFDLGIFFDMGVKPKIFLREKLKASVSYLGYLVPALLGLNSPLRVQTTQFRQLQSTSRHKTWFVIDKSQEEPPLEQ